MNAVRFLALSVVGLLCAGCITLQEFHHLRREVEELKDTENRVQSSSVSEERLAELGAQVSALHDEVARLRGLAEEAKHLAEQAANEARTRTNVQSVPGAAALTGTVGEELRAYEQAFSIYRAGEYEAAVDRFNGFLQTYPSSDHADNALFWMGECYFKLGDFERAVLTFEQVVTRFPEGNKVPDALYRQGIALMEIGKQTDQQATYQAAAKQIFGRIVEEHEQSERVAEARRQLERIQ